MTEKEAIAAAKRSIIEDCPEFSEKECEHVAYRVVEALIIEGLEFTGHECRYRHSLCVICGRPDHDGVA